METDIIAERVRTAREWRGWTQQELARRAELHPVVLNRLEKKHKAGVQAETLRRLALALQVSTDYLLGIPDNVVDALAQGAAVLRGRTEDSPGRAKPPQPKKRPRQASPAA
jgi:transcriptional regulator with XRE-family HTH domain